MDAAGGYLDGKIPEYPVKGNEVVASSENRMEIIQLFLIQGSKGPSPDIDIASKRTRYLRKYLLQLAYRFWRQFNY